MNHAREPVFSLAEREIEMLVVFPSKLPTGGADCPPGALRGPQNVLNAKLNAS
jgi:hypothetical protein